MEDALVAESLTYSMLQTGPEHQRWFAEHRDPRGRVSAKALAAEAPDGSLLRRVAEAAIAGGPDAAPGAPPAADDGDVLLAWGDLVQLASTQPA